MKSPLPDRPHRAPRASTWTAGRIADPRDRTAESHPGLRGLKWAAAASAGGSAASVSANRFLLPADGSGQRGHQFFPDGIQGRVGHLGRTAGGSNRKADANAGKARQAGCHRPWKPVGSAPPTAMGGRISLRSSAENPKRPLLDQQAVTGGQGRRCGRRQILQVQQVLLPASGRKGWRVAMVCLISSSWIMRRCSRSTRNMRPRFQGAPCEPHWPDPPAARRSPKP